MDGLENVVEEMKGDDFGSSSFLTIIISAFMPSLNAGASFPAFPADILSRDSSSRAFGDAKALKEIIITKKTTASGGGRLSSERTERYVTREEIVVAFTKGEEGKGEGRGGGSVRGLGSDM